MPARESSPEPAGAAISHRLPPDQRRDRVDSNGLPVLERQECLDLLRCAHIGRVSVTDNALPVILPVSYGMLGDDVVFCTGSGAKARAAIDKAVVAFEVDSIDTERREGWSVCVTGVASEVLDRERRARVEALHIEPLVPVERQRYVVVATQLIEGRRLGVRTGCGPVDESDARGSDGRPDQA